MTTLTQLLEDAAGRHGRAPFLRNRQGETSYAELLALSCGYARSLAEQGVSAGDAVALLMDNSTEQVALWFALNRMGALHAPLNTALSGPRLLHALAVAAPRVVIADPHLAAPVRDAVEGMDGVRLLEPGDLAPAAGSGEPCPAPAPVDELDTATLLFTSGTTGPSKACALSHRYLVRQGQLHADALGLHSGDVLYSPFPLFHIDAATLTVVAALSVGGTAAVGQRFSASGFWDEIRAYDATVFNFMGATLSILWKRPPSPRDRDHRLRLGWGVPIPHWWRGFEQRFGVPLRQVYGLTDAGVPVYDPVTGPRKPGAAGRVLDAFEIRITDRDGAGVPAGTAGEIVVRGREEGLVMNGYHGMPEATAQTVVDGWVRTGDLGVLDDDGYLTFLGRLTDSIRRRGENISAFEVEQIVAAFPDVQEVAAIGVPSELTEEDVMVVVVPRAGATLDPAALSRHCRANGPAYLAPRYIEIVEQLPKTPTQKVEKFQLTSRGVQPGTWDADAHR